MNNLNDEEKNLVDEVKSLLLIDCIDGIFVSIKKAKRFLKSKKATKHYSDVLKSHDCLMSYDEAIDAAITELEKDGEIVVADKKIRRKFTFEKTN